jgi:hypothetical protein
LPDQVNIEAVVTRKQFRAFCYPGETIKDLKQRIQDEEGIPIDRQRLVYAGRQLADDMYLGSCLQPNCEVVLYLRLKGC